MILPSATGVASCTAADLDGNGQVVINELVTNVSRALGGCFGALAGSWFGPVIDNLSTEGTAQTLTIDGNGGVVGAEAQLSARLTRLDRVNRLYALRRSDGITGALQFSADARHALYIDAASAFGALEKSATGLAAYSDDDLGGDVWSGSVVRFAAAAPDAFATIDRAALFVATLADRSFHLRAEDFDLASDAVTLSLRPMVQELGLFQGNWTGTPGSAGGATFLITPDKNFLAAQMCGSGDSFGTCTLSAWSRAVGTYAPTCTNCQTTLPPGLDCQCLTSEQVFVDSFIPLPCVGSIDNIEGTLTCNREE
jgi:hypothetical protein